MYIQYILIMFGLPLWMTKSHTSHETWRWSTAGGAGPGPRGTCINDFSSRVGIAGSNPHRWENYPRTADFCAEMVCYKSTFCLLICREYSGVVFLVFPLHSFFLAIEHTIASTWGWIASRKSRAVPVSKRIPHSPHIVCSVPSMTSRIQQICSLQLQFLRAFRPVRGS